MDKERDKIAELLKQVELSRDNLHDHSSRSDGIRQTLKLVVDYIEFMLTPCTDED